VRRGALVQLYGERERVEGMHQREPPRHVLRLIALEMPDQVPSRAASGRRVDLLQRLLHPILTEVGEARGECGLDRIQPEALRDGDDGHRVRPAAGSLAAGDFGPHVGQPLGQGPKIHNRKK